MDAKTRPDAQDYDTVRREYPDVIAAADRGDPEQAAHAYRLAQAAKLIRLYEAGRLPLELMREMDKIPRT